MTKKINRRQFIESSALAAGATMFAPSILEALGIGTRIPTGYPAAQKPLSSFDGQVRALLAKMTLEEKVGQMTQAEQDALKDVNDIQKYFLGSVLSGGNSDPKAGNSLVAWTDMCDGYQEHALKTRLGIPLLYGADAVHGHNNVLGAVIFPHNVGLGCTRNPKLVESAARVTAEEVRATGVNWTFAPCVTVPRDERWGRTYEGFGETPELARTLGEAAVRGLQRNDLAEPLSVLVCAKHYVGDGGTTIGTAGFANPDGKRLLDQGDTQLSEADLRKIHLQGYITTVQAGVGSIMPSYNSWNGVKVSGIRRLLTGILKQELGFQGFLISDYNALNQIAKDYKEAMSMPALIEMAMASL